MRQRLVSVDEENKRLILYVLDLLLNFLDAITVSPKTEKKLKKKNSAFLTNRSEHEKLSCVIKVSNEKNF
jgi:hypothetical protein